VTHSNFIIETYTNILNGLIERKKRREAIDHSDNVLYGLSTMLEDMKLWSLAENAMERAVAVFEAGEEEVMFHCLETERAAWKLFGDMFTPCSDRASQIDALYLETIPEILTELNK
jgi:hypothetical protein